MITSSQAAYRLFHQGSLAFSEIEANGIRIDTGYLDEAIRSTDEKIKVLRKELEAHPIFLKVWKRAFPDKANILARPQLTQVVFKHLGHAPTGLTEKGNVKGDAAALESVDDPFVRQVLYLDKLRNAKSTFLEGIRSETVNGFLHPVFNLHLVRTLRSSSDSPNFQNFPTRDPEIAELIRRCFIPRDGRGFIEIDYGALEFVIAACFWRDPKMVAYASDPKLDIHRDAASWVYKCRPEQVGKKPRYCAKNQFVFPTLYGSYYRNTCRHLWESIGHHGLKLEDGTPLGDHLRRQGITELGACDPERHPLPGTFEHHVQSVERDFHKRFPVWSRSREDWWNEYQTTGAFRIMTGFVVRGVYSKNDLMNYPVQGPAFHCLLQSLIWLLKDLKRAGMGSLVVGQIHDCILADVPEEETDDYVGMVQEIMTTRLRAAWDWIICPLKAEVEVCPVGASWFYKEKM